MNERIAELAIQAGGVWSGGYVEQANGNSVWTDKKFVEDVDTEYFAKLIVRECASQVRFTDLLKCNDDSDGEILLQASVQLKKHFGIE